MNIEIHKHLTRDYLKDEFLFVSNKIDNSWEHAQKLKQLLNTDITSLDQIFSCMRIPVLLTYDSKTIKSFRASCAEYQQAFEKEILEGHNKFINKCLPDKVLIHLFLVPFEEKKRFVEIFDEKLRACQSI